ncbi:hypothetical protein LguiB_028097 [Lonicera macranthoides]
MAKRPEKLPQQQQQQQKQRMSNAERSSYFARREAAKVLRTVLQGDARRRAVGSIKTLVYSPSVRNKKATFALLCQTLKHLPIIKDVLDATSILNSKWKRQGELMYIITYDILFGQAALLVGDAEKFLLLRKDALQSALARLLVRKKVKNIEDLKVLYQIPDIPKPRYVRVNTLKLDIKNALDELGKQNTVKKDDMVPDLLVLPPGTDLHNHPLVTNGSVFMQGKASSMVAVALGPKPGWEVIDACSAPGNKTVHLAALMKGEGRIIACELNKDRVKRLQDTIALAGANNVEVLHGDFLKLNSKDPSYSKVRGILLDPSCSGSGTAADRLDHLLPSYATGQGDATDIDRLTKLAAFQKKALEHALSFPAVERVVYSTCSIHQIENEEVVKSVIPLAASYGFQLATPFPQWPRRGLPILEESVHLLRTDPVEDKEGFFIALFVRESIHEPEKAIGSKRINEEDDPYKGKFISKKKKALSKNRFVPYYPFNKMSKMWLYLQYGARKSTISKR